MFNAQQNMMPYAYDMTNDLPTSGGMGNRNIPGLAPSMQTPMNNRQSFMPSMQNAQPSYAHGGHAMHHHNGADSYLQQLQRKARELAAQAYGQMPSAMDLGKDALIGGAAYGAGLYGGLPASALVAGAGNALLKHGNPVNNFGKGVGGALGYAGGMNAMGYADGGSVGIEALLQNMSPEELQQLLAGGNDEMGAQQGDVPHYKIGGIFKGLKKVAKIVAPVIGGIAGNLVGGPVGGAIGAGLGAKLGGAKTKNALLAGAAGYGLSGGLGAMGGLGNVTNALTPTALAKQFGTSAAANGASKAGLAGSIFGGGGGQGGGFNLGGLGALPLIGAAGMVLGKPKVPKEPSISEHMQANKRIWGPEHQYRKTKPLERVQKELGSEGLFFEDVNPETQYMAHGGYLDGTTGGQADDIDAKLSDGEYVLSADVVSHLGDGNNSHGAKKLDAFMRKVRTHKLKNGGRLPPKARGIEAYLHGRA